MKNTPGPWHYDETQDSTLIEALVDPENSDTYYAPIAHVDTDWTGETAWANARLIAAAPDLLEALEEASELISHAKDCPYRHHGECLCVRSRIVAAIGKTRP